MMMMILERKFEEMEWTFLCD